MSVSEFETGEGLRSIDRKRPLTRLRFATAPSPTRAEGKRLAQNFNPVILDHGVGQQLVGGILQRRLGLGLVGAR